MDGATSLELEVRQLLVILPGNVQHVESELCIDSFRTFKKELGVRLPLTWPFQRRSTSAEQEEWPTWPLLAFLPRRPG